MGVCRACDEYAWIIDLRGYCVDCEDSRPDTSQSLDLLFAMRDNLRRIEERMSEYVLSTDIPLQLVKEAEDLRARIHTLEEQLSLKEET